MKTKKEILQNLDSLRSEAVLRPEVAQVIQDVEHLVRERDYFIELSADLRIALLDAIREICPHISEAEYLEEMERFVNEAAAKPVARSVQNWLMNGEVTDAGFQPKSE